MALIAPEGVALTLTVALIAPEGVALTLTVALIAPEGVATEEEMQRTASQRDE